MSIPRLKLNGSAYRAIPASVAGDGKPGAGGATADRSHSSDASTLYAEALRDRLMMHFQLRGLNHKPKLVGVTSCGHRAGGTTIASSLAAALSETGDGNVLYVDVNQDRGASLYPFQHGKLSVGIRDALEEQTRDSAKVQDNLYMASLADPVSGKVGVVPKTLSGLVPRMKDADIVLELRSGAVGTDTADSFLGTPEIALPGMVTVPEMRFITRNRQSAMAKIGLVAYDAKTRELLGSGGVSSSLSRDNNWYVMGVGPYQQGEVKREIRRTTLRRPGQTYQELPTSIAFQAPSSDSVPDRVQLTGEEQPE